MLSGNVALEQVEDQAEMDFGNFLNKVEVYIESVSRLKSGSMYVDSSGSFFDSAKRQSAIKPKQLQECIIDLGDSFKKMPSFTSYFNMTLGCDLNSWSHHEIEAFKHFFKAFNDYPLRLTFALSQLGNLEKTKLEAFIATIPAAQNIKLISLATPDSSLPDSEIASKVSPLYLMLNKVLPKTPVAIAQFMERDERTLLINMQYSSIKGMVCLKEREPESSNKEDIAMPSSPTMRK